MSEPIVISGLNIYTEHGKFPAGSICVQDQKIIEVSRNAVIETTGQHFKFPANYHLLPGRIDMHIHGANGADVMDATPEALDTIRATLAQEGVTGFLATTVTESVDHIEQALRNIADYQPHQPGAEILGVHLEGPFISPRCLGAHREELLAPPDFSIFSRWQQCAGGKIKLVTVAPELPGGIEFITSLCEQEVVAAIGHTAADFAVTQAAIDAGARHATHLFNAMRAFHHREPGCIGAILLDDRVTAELIVDGVHLHPATIRLAIRTKGLNRLVLVSDAMRAKCCKSGNTFDLGGQTVTVMDGAARLNNGVLAGSVLTITQAVKNMLDYTNYTLADIVGLTSINPAKALNIFTQTGSISVGKRADLIVLDENLDVILTICAGRIVYQGNNERALV
jgi:N-acetylglucosamine-6-phosphate deacetylase